MSEKQSNLKIAELSVAGRTILAAAVVFLLGSYLCSAIYSSEFYWHLSLGHLINGSRSLSTSEFWAYLVNAGSGDSSWIFQLSLSSIENHFGERGLLLFKLLSCTSLVAALLIVYHSWANDLFFAGVVTTLVACGILINVPFTPRFFSWMFFALFCHCIFTIRYRRAALFLFVLFGAASVAMANVHLVSLFCIALLPFALILPAAKDANRGPHLVLFFLILFAAQFCTPYASSLIPRQIEKCLGFIELALVGGFQPATVYDFSSGFLLLLTTILGSLYYSEPDRLRIQEVVLLAVAVIAGCISKSLLPYSLIFSGTLLCLVWSRAEKVEGNLGEAILMLKAKLGGFPAVGITFLLLCVVFVNCSKLYAQPSVSAFFPVREVDQLLAEKYGSPVYHPRDIAGYMAYRFSSVATPYQVMPASQIEFLDPELTKRVSRIDSLAPGWQEFWEEELRPATAVVRYDSAIYSYLLEDEQWQLVFQNGEPWPVVESDEPSSEPGMFSWALFVRR